MLEATAPADNAVISRPGSEFRGSEDLELSTRSGDLATKVQPGTIPVSVLQKGSQESNVEKVGETAKNQGLGSLITPCSLYWTKYFGAGGKAMSIPDSVALFIAVFGAFILMGILSCMHYCPAYPSNYTIIISSFGANAVIGFSAPMSPLTQPRNILLGHMSACVIGIGCRIWIADPMETPGLAIPLALALSVLFMSLTGSTHPPAGGTALFAVLADKNAAALGWGLLVPCLVASIITILLGVILNNIHIKVTYPVLWFIETPASCKT